MKYCRKCGSQLKDNAKYCPSCGTLYTATEAPENPTPKKKRGAVVGICLAAVLLAAGTGGIIGWKFLHHPSEKQERAGDVLQESSDVLSEKSRQEEEKEEEKFAESQPESVESEGKTAAEGIRESVEESTQETSEAVLISLSVVNCRESITLRPAPSTDSGEICQIPLGAEVGFVAGAEDGFYEIRYEGQQGYALSSYLGEAGKTEMIKADENPEIYTYEMMTEDLERLAYAYPELTTLESLADTPDGRNVWHMTIGKQGANRHFFVNASIHGREYVTSWLVMRQASQFLKDCANSGFLPEDVMIHLVPMVNPDGVSISQMGLEGCQKQETKDLVSQIMARECEGDPEEYLKKWKANAQGIDLNRNFDAMWEEYQDGVGVPSADHYKGTSPGCAPEAAALIRLTEGSSFEKTISYHAQGSVIYWNFGQSGQLKEETEQFAGKISKITGYALDGDFSLLDPAGYKDWAITKKEIPSVTIEVGRETTPVPYDQLPVIWQENREVWKAMME